MASAAFIQFNRYGISSPTVAVAISASSSETRELMMIAVFSIARSISNHAEAANSTYFPAIPRTYQVV